MTPETTLQWRTRCALWLRRFSSALRLAARRQIIRWSRKLLDFLDERLHAAEVRLRDDLGQLGLRGRSSAQAPAQRADRAGVLRAAAPTTKRETFVEWEARRSGVAVISKKEARRQRTTAAGFDLRFVR